MKTYCRSIELSIVVEFENPILDNNINWYLSMVFQKIEKKPATCKTASSISSSGLVTVAVAVELEVDVVEVDVVASTIVVVDDVVDIAKRRFKFSYNENDTEPCDIFSKKK